MAPIRTPTVSIRLIAAVLLSSVAATAFSFNAHLTLHTPNPVIDRLNANQNEFTMTGRLEINEPFLGLALWIPYAYREGSSAHRNDYTISTSFLGWLQLQNGQPGIYDGPLFTIQMDPSDPGGLYNHVFASPALPYVYAYRNGNPMDRSNEVPYTITLLAPGRVTCNVTLEGWQGAVEGQYLEVQVRNGAGTQWSYEPLTANGQVVLETGLDGPAEILLKGATWLRRSSGVQTLGQPITLDFTLLAGDCDGDNEITIGDYATLSAAFGSSPGDENWDPSADVNGDETVDVGDFSLLSGNFGVQGDE